MRYRLTRDEQYLQLLIAVGTNAFALPCTYRLGRRGRYLEMVIGLAAMASSMCYHWTEATNGAVLYLRKGGWHRVDNVFAVMSLASLMVYLMGNASRKADEALAWGCFVLTMWAQEVAPWDLKATYAPVLLALLLCIARYAHARQLPVFFADPTERRTFLQATAVLAVAIVCFVLGLDEKKDHLRLKHGTWHMLLGIAMFLYFTVDVRKVAREGAAGGEVESASKEEEPPPQAAREASVVPATGGAGDAGELRQRNAPGAVDEE